MNCIKTLAADWTISQFFFKVTKDFFQTRDLIIYVFYPTNLSYVQMTKKYDLSQKGFSFPMMCEIENS